MMEKKGKYVAYVVKSECYNTFSCGLLKNKENNLFWSLVEMSYDFL